MSNTRVRDLRKMAGMTQEQVAFKAGCSVGYYRHLEAVGLPTGKSRVVAEVASALGVSVSELRGPLT